MSEASEVRVRLILDRAGGCAVLVTSGRRDASIPADVPRIRDALAAAGLRLAGLSIATRSPTSPDARPLARGETVADAVRRALADGAALGAAT